MVPIVPAKARGLEAIPFVRCVDAHSFLSRQSFAHPVEETLLVVIHSGVGCKLRNLFNETVSKMPFIDFNLRYYLPQSIK